MGAMFPPESLLTDDGAPDGAVVVGNVFFDGVRRSVEKEK